MTAYHFAQYSELLTLLAQEMNRSGDDTDAAECIRVELDALWPHLGGDERELVGLLSEDLYFLHDPPAAKSLTRSSFEELQAFMNSDFGGNLEKLHEWLRTRWLSNFALSAYCRGQVWMARHCTQAGYHFMDVARRHSSRLEEIEAARNLFGIHLAQNETFKFGNHDRAIVMTHAPFAYNNKMDPEHVERRRAISDILMSFYRNKTLPRSRWNKEPPGFVTWKDEKGVQRQSVSFGYSDLDRTLEAKGSEFARDMGLPSPRLAGHQWLDKSLGIEQLTYAPSNHLERSFPFTITTELFGSNFPVHPTLDRDGYATTSPQHALIEQVISTRAAMITHGAAFVSPEGRKERSALSLLMDYVGSVTTLMDVTLNQAFYKAMYDGRSVGLKYDAQLMPTTVGRSFRDKLEWVKHMTGKPLDDRKGLAAFNALRHVRNHLAHFDPPVFACSVDDVVTWLNYAGDVGLLFIRLRKHLGCGFSERLIDLALAPRVCVQLQNEDKPYFPQAVHAGYASSTWPGPPPTRGTSLTVPSKIRRAVEEIHRRIEEQYPGSRSLEDVWLACMEHGVRELERARPSELIHRTRRPSKT